MVKSIPLYRIALETSEDKIIAGGGKKQYYLYMQSSYHLRIYKNVFPVQY